VSQSFGKCIKDARRSKSYSQRDLASLVGCDYTYLSKLENDRADYPPKEDLIRSLIEHLDLDIDLAKLSYLSGRITPEDSKVIQELAKAYQDKMPVLLRKMQDPETMRRLLENEDELS
jgi:HTH-type transcriptional regulator, competence development regulator